MSIRFVTACHSQSQPAANPQSRSVTRAALKIGTRPHKSGITRAVPNASIFLTIFLWSRVLAAVSCAFSATSNSLTKTELSLKTRAIFCRDRGPQQRKQTPYFGDPRSHITPQGFSPDFHPWIHAFPNCCSSLLLPHANCSCSLCCWDDDHMMTWWKDCLWTFFCSSEVFELNFLWRCYRTHPAYCKICNQKQSRTMQV